MEYNVIKKTCIGNETSRSLTIKSTLEEAKAQYHTVLSNAYSATDLQFALCAIMNDVGGVELEEHYRKALTITFNGNGATSGVMNTQRFLYGEEQTLAPCTYEKDGAVFSGWATTADAASPEYTDEQSVSFTADTTLYAIWS